MKRQQGVTKQLGLASVFGVTPDTVPTTNTSSRTYIADKSRLGVGNVVVQNLDSINNHRTDGRVESDQEPH